MMDADSDDVLKEQCEECNGRGTRLRYRFDGSQQVELCNVCHGKGQVYTDVDKAIKRLADRAISSVFRRSKAR
jgi:DnaJ-class molecular chaperone